MTESVTASDFRQWWREITLKGDPMRHPNLVKEAFEAGYNAGVLATIKVENDH